MKLPASACSGLIHFVALASISSLHQVLAHSWIEVANPIVNGQLQVASIGRARGPIPHTPGWTDPESVYMVPEITDAGFQFSADRNMCKYGKGNNTVPQLSLTPGEWVAIRYLENGHVTMPNVPQGHPKGSGAIFIYGSSDLKDDDKFLAIHRVWNAAGDGGDHRGKLLATRHFDDGQCYEDNTSRLSAQRQLANPTTAGGLMGPNVWCQSDIQIPADTPAGTFSVAWVWDWPILEDSFQNADVFPFQGDGVVSNQTYSSCIDFTITTGPTNSTNQSSLTPRGMDMETATVASQLANLYLLDYGDLTNVGPSIHPSPQSPSAAPPSPSSAATSSSSSASTAPPSSSSAVPPSSFSTAPPSPSSVAPLLTLSTVIEKVAAPATVTVTVVGAINPTVTVTVTASTTLNAVFSSSSSSSSPATTTTTVTTSDAVFLGNTPSPIFSTLPAMSSSSSSPAPLVSSSVTKPLLVPFREASSFSTVLVPATLTDSCSHMPAPLPTHALRPITINSNAVPTPSGFLGRRRVRI